MTITKTTLPAIPSGVSPDMRNYLERIREELMRSRSNQDTINNTITTIINNGVNNGLPVNPVNPTNPVPLPPSQPPYGGLPCGKPATPTAPTNVSVTGGFEFYMISWDFPNYCGHAHSEIYSNSGSGDVVSSELLLLGTSGGTTFTVAEPSSGRRRCFWVRHVNLLGVRGPFQSEQGICATTALDPGPLIEALTGKITETQLYRSLGDRINRIDLPGTGLIDQNFYRQSETGMLARRVSEISVSTKVSYGSTAPANPATGDLWYDTNTSPVTLKRWSGSAWVVIRTSVKTFMMTSAPQVGTDGPFVVGDLWYDTDANNRAYYWNGSTWVDLLTAFTEARIVDLSDARIGYCTTSGGIVTGHGDRAQCLAAGNTWNLGLPWANAVKQVSITYNGQTVTIQQQMEAIYGPDGLRAQYAVKIDNAGMIAGFGLSSEPTAAGATSSFVVRADHFGITGAATASATAPTTNLYAGKVWLNTSNGKTYYYTGSAWSEDKIYASVPFQVLTSPATNPNGGDPIPPGVYITDAYIKDATITSAKIRNLAVTNAKINDLSASKITTGTLSVGECISSTQTDGTNPLWQICGGGGASFRSITIYDDNGQVLLSSGGNTLESLGANNIIDSQMQTVLTNITVPLTDADAWTWYQYNNAGGANAPVLAINASTPVRPQGANVVSLKPHATGGQDTNLFSGLFPVVAGRYYEVFCDAAHLYVTTSCVVRVYWYKPGVLPTDPPVAVAGTPYNAIYPEGQTSIFTLPAAGSDLTNLNDWVHCEGIVQAPSTATLARISFVATGGFSSLSGYLAMTRPFMGPVTTSGYGGYGIHSYPYSKWSATAFSPVTRYNRSTYIKDAAIDSATIQDAAITNAKISDLSADKITSGSITSAEVVIGTGTVASSTPVAPSLNPSEHIVFDANSQNLWVRYLDGTWKTALRMGYMQYANSKSTYGILIHDRNGKVVMASAGTENFSGTDAWGASYPGTTDAFISSYNVRNIRTDCLYSSAVNEVFTGGFSTVSLPANTTTGVYVMPTAVNTPSGISGVHIFFLAPITLSPAGLMAVNIYHVDPSNNNLTLILNRTFTTPIAGYLLYAVDFMHVAPSTTTSKYQVSILTGAGVSGSVLNGNMNVTVHKR